MSQGRQGGFSDYLELFFFAVILSALFIISTKNYLLFHSLAEIFSVVISFGIFAFAWNSRRILSNNFFQLIGAAYLFIAVIQSFHLLSYKGMPVIVIGGKDVASQLWIASRYIFSLSFLCAVRFINRKLNLKFLFLILLVTTGFLFLSVFYWKNFPECFVERHGLTIFKKISEYITIAFLIVAEVFLFKKRRFFDRTVFNMLIVSIAVSVLVGVVFSLYSTLYGTLNILGHLLLIVSSYILYRAIVVTGLRSPYAIILRDLKSKEDLLTASEARYRAVVEDQAELISRWGLDFEMSFVNEAICKFFGKTKDEFLGKKLTLLLPEGQRGRFIESVLGLNINKPSGSFEHWVKLSDGSKHLVKWHNRAIFDKKCRIIEYQGIGRDITKEKSIENEMELLSRFPSENPNPVMKARSDGFLMYANPSSLSFLSQWGFKVGEFLNDEFKRLIGEAFISGEAINAEVEKEGRFFSIDLAPIVHDNYVNMYGFDITERKRVEKEKQAFSVEVQQLLLANQRRLSEQSAIFASISDPVIVYGADGVITSANAAAKDYLNFDPVGLREEQVLERISSEISGDKMPGREDAVSCRVLRGEKIKDRPYYLKDASGAERFVLVSGSAILDRSQYIGAVIVWHDMTELKKVERELLKLNETLEARVIERTGELSLMNKRLIEANETMERIFSNTQISICCLDREFNFLRVNHSYASIDGQKPEYFIGKNHFELYPYEENKRIFQYVVDKAKPYFAFSKPFISREHPVWGTTYWDWSLQPVKNDDGKVGSLILILIDVTKRKKAEEGLARAEAALNEAKRLSEIGTLAATVAHELRNPLGVIRTAAFNLKRKAQNPLFESHFSNIDKKIQESDQIINNLLFYSRIKLPQLQEIKICDCLDECVNAVKLKFKSRKISIKKDLKPLKSVSIDADPVQICEVFNNLLNNAFEAITVYPGIVEVSCGFNGKSEIFVSIRDNGCGIDGENLRRISEPFFSTKSKGTGLGLTVSFQIVKLHRGRIEIESRSGRGSCFKVIIPLGISKTGGA